MKKWERKYLVRFLQGMIGYSILLPLSLIVVGGGRVEQTWLAVLIVLLPMAPFSNAMLALIRNVQSQDELYHRIHLEAVLITALLTGGLSFTYGLLEASELVPPLPTIFIAPFMIFTWGIANVAVSRRYN